MNIWQFVHVKIMKILIFEVCIIQFLSLLLCHQTKKKAFMKPNMMTCCCCCMLPEKFSGGYLIV